MALNKSGTKKYTEMHDGHWGPRPKKNKILTPVMCPPIPPEFFFLFAFSLGHGLMDRVSNIQKARKHTE